MPHTKDEGIEHIGVRAYRAAALVARHLPERFSSTLSALVAAGFAQAMRERRAIVARNLTRIDPTLSGRRLDRAIRATFDSYAAYWLESFRLPYLDPVEVDTRFSYRGYGQIPEALKQGSGCILALPHLGGWEWAGRWMVDQGHSLTVVVEPIEPPELFEFFVELRRSLGMTIIGLGPDAGPAVIRALRANEVVCLICDRDIQGTGVPVDFFGEPTTMPAGPVTVALRTGAPLLPTAVYFTGSHNGHVGVVRPALTLDRQGSLREDVVRHTQALTRELELLIRQAPSQWHMMQPLWPADADLAD